MLDSLETPVPPTTTEPDLDSPRVNQFPLTAVLGDGPVVAVLNTLIASRRTPCLGELEDVTGYSREAIREAVANLKAVGAIEEPSPGMYRAHWGSEVLRSFAAAERELVVKLHPDSYFAQVVEQDR